MNREWDGVIRHKTKPGNSGYKRWHCRCPECCVAGDEINRRNREREQAIRDGEYKVENFTHGIQGWRLHGCRCHECEDAYRAFLSDNRAAGRNRRSYKKAETPEQQLAAVPDEVPSVDWSEVAHLRPGANVRRRSA
jgi:hypothetical protein